MSIREFLRPLGIWPTPAAIGIFFVAVVWIWGNWKHLAHVSVPKTVAAIFLTLLPVVALEVLARTAVGESALSALVVVVIAYGCYTGLMPVFLKQRKDAGRDTHHQGGRW